MFMFLSPWLVMNSAAESGCTGKRWRRRARLRSRGGARMNGLGLKTPPVLRRPHLQQAQEHAAHRLGSAEATGGGDRGDRLCGVLQSAARSLQADPLDVAGG